MSSEWCVVFRRKVSVMAIGLLGMAGSAFL